MKGGFWQRDWFSAVVLTALFGLASVTGATFLETLERVAYDFGVRISNRSPGEANHIAIVAIDDNSIAKIGRWPWPRSVLAQMIGQLADAHPKVVGLQIFLSENQTDPGLAYLRQVSDVLNGSRLPRVAPAETQQLAQIVSTAEQELNTDQKLAQAVTTAGDVVMPMFFRIGPALGKPDAPLPDFVVRNRVVQVQDSTTPGAPLPAYQAIFPLPEFASGTLGIGHLNLLPDVDGGVRAEPLLIDYYGEYYPSLALLLAAKSLNLNAGDISVRRGDSVQLGNLNIKTDARMRMYTAFYPERGDEPAFPTYSFFDVQTGKVPATSFRDKIVLIGPTAVGVGSTQVTPVSKAMSGPELTANVVASILNQDFYTRPAWAHYTELAVFALLLLYLMLVLPRLGAGPAGLLSLALLVVLLVGADYVLVTQQVWLKAVTPALLLLTGYVWLTTKRFFVTERQKVKVETDSAHTNRMLGLAFQGQGQLDMALDKFRALPVDESVLDLIYNLALDFERKRQFNKASAAYDYILQHAPRFRDAAARRQRAQQAEGAVMLGGKSAGPGGTVLVQGIDQKPTLGRYEIERELGKGAMGAVYLGRDPKINRVVAIKTLALSQEFAEQEIDAVKQRFFREAETAGRLNHPNIVTIYDAGEDQDLAYIAMELLQGQDLTAHTRAQQLLPVPEVLRIVAQIADALTYAHTNDVVHRDIKPANVMYDRGQIKVTDFGIARITAASRTKTGMVLGTPSYMSPEQLAGKHVDGRSDLFSLGVMLFELLTGSLPFDGESLATLTYQIANTPHPDILAVCPNLPAAMRAIIDRALAKDPEQRFQTGGDFATALRTVVPIAVSTP